MGAECSKCGFDICGYGECEHCKLIARTEQIKSKLDAAMAELEALWAYAENSEIPMSNKETKRRIEKILKGGE